MSLLGKGVLAFTTATTIQEIPMPNETSKLIISGVFSLASVLVVELFKFLKTKRSKNTNQTNVEDKQPNKDHDNQSGQVTLTADNL